MTTMLLFAAMVVVLYKVINVAFSLGIDRFSGHPWRFSAIALSWALIGSGSLAVFAGANVGGPMILSGVAMLVIADRRRKDRRRIKS